VVRIANSVAGVTDSIVSPAGDRLGAKAGGTLVWLLPDLGGDIAGSLTSDETALANAIRYDSYGQTIATGTAGVRPRVGTSRHEPRLPDASHARRTRS
jgi:hypothetical protein